MNAVGTWDVGIVGAGPAGLMAAQVLAEAGWRVGVVDGAASPGRKFLLAGVGGLNLTHAEGLSPFLSRYATSGPDMAPRVAAWVQAFPPDALRAWAETLGVRTFVGSSGRVFPEDMKAAPLLRSWIHRLRGLGVRFVMRHRWVGWDAQQQPVFQHAGMPLPESLQPRARLWLLALGGGSWARLGSDGAWQPLLAQRGVALSALLPSNGGFEVGATACSPAGWSAHLRQKHEGAPLKNIAATVRDPHTGQVLWSQRGECVIARYGLEGNLVYAASGWLRAIWQTAGAQGPGGAVLELNLLPALAPEKVASEVARARGPRSWSTHLKSRLGLDGAKLALLHELCPKALWSDPSSVAQAVGALRVPLVALRPLDEAISTAGGVRAEALTDGLALKTCPGVYAAGEMLDWDAPTGGYLLTAALASGRWAGAAMDRALRSA